MRSYWWVAFALWATLAFNGQAAAAPRAVLILTGPVPPAELWEPTRPGLGELAARGSRVLINVQTAGGPAELAGYVTLGAGARARAPAAAAPALNAAESWDGVPAVEVHRRRTGSEEGGAVFHLGAAEIATENARPEVGVRTGALGEALARAGLSVVVVGNADVPGRRVRGAAAVAMDAGGTVAGGDVGPAMNVADPTAPFGVRSDYRAMLAYLRGPGAGADLVVVHAGDVERAVAYAPYCTPAQAAAHLRAALDRLGVFVQELFTVVALDETLVVVVPVWAPSDQSQVQPGIVCGPGLEGQLTSGTTRRPGLVTNTDVAPTILSWFGLPVPTGMTGRPLRVTTVSGAIDLEQLERRIRQNFLQRSPVLQSYITLDVLAVVVALACIYLRVRFPTWLTFYLLCLVVLPAVALAWPYLGAHGGVMPTLTVVGAGSALAALALVWVCRGRWPVALAAGCALASAVIVVDQAAGWGLVGDTPFGYSAALGARFYGLGNEYMGYLVGASIVGSACLLQVSAAARRWGALVASCWLGLGVLALVRGANVGGVVTAVVGSVVAVWRLPAFSARGRWLATGMVAVLALVLVTAELARDPADRSHLGLALQQVTGDRGQLAAVAHRKLAVNLKLLRWTIWSRAALVSMGGYLLLCWRPSGLLGQVRADLPFIHAGVSTAAWTSVVALLCNDSGVVAAATALIPATAALLLAAGGAQREKAEVGLGEP